MDFLSESFLIFLAVIFFMYIFVFSLKDVVCPQCGFHGQERKTPQGSLIVEIILWLFLIIPGLVYTFWRRSKKTFKCPSCGHDGMVPSDSPKGKELIENNRKNA